MTSDEESDLPGGCYAWMFWCVLGSIFGMMFAMVLLFFMGDKI